MRLNNNLLCNQYSSIIQYRYSQKDADIWNLFTLYPEQFLSLFGLQIHT
jgi:hypothetical protein